MKDEEVIQDAYAEAVALLYNVLRVSYTDAGGDANREKKADEAFVAGLKLARKARDRALQLIK